MLRKPSRGCGSRWRRVSGDAESGPKARDGHPDERSGEPWTQSGLRQKLQAWALKRGHKVVPHGLRKNAVIALLEADCSVSEVSAITDHSLAMVEHYGKGRDQRKIGRGAIVKACDDEHRKGDRRIDDAASPSSTASLPNLALMKAWRRGTARR
jgi:hypothetical protein